MIFMTFTMNSAFVMTVVSSVPDMFLNSITKDHLSTVEPASPHAQTYQLTNEQTANIREYLFISDSLYLVEHMLEIPASPLVSTSHCWIKWLKMWMT